MFGKAFGTAVGSIICLICFSISSLLHEQQSSLVLLWLFPSLVMGICFGIPCGLFAELGLRQAIQEEIRKMPLKDGNKDPSSVDLLPDSRRQQPFVKTP